MAITDLSNIPVRASHDWRSIPARAVDRYYVGLDIGQSIDPSAVAVLHHVVKPLDEWVPNAESLSGNISEDYKVFGA